VTIDALENCGYVRDLLDQPRALEETIRGLSATTALQAIAGELRAGRFDRIVLTGMGSSLYALQTLHLRLIARGFTPLVAETSELLYSMSAALEGSALLVAVSQSGRSVEIVRLLSRDGPRPRTIGVTNDAGSPLALETDAAVVTRAGVEDAVACKTYLSTLAALEWLAAVFLGEDPGAAKAALSEAPPLVARYLSHWKEHVAALLPTMYGVRHVFLTGRGSSLATAANGALILKESAHVHAEGMSSAAFRHGPMEILREDVFVVVFAGDEATRALNERLAEDIGKAGGRVTVVGERAETEVFRLAACAAPVRPILEMLPVQMMSLALAAHAGHEPGRFRLASKVTTVE